VDPDVDVGLFLFVGYIALAARMAPHGLAFEAPDYRRHVALLESGNVSLVTAIAAGSPGGVSGEVFYRDEFLISAQELLRKRPEIDPFEVVLTEIVKRVVEVEAVDIDDRSCGHRFA
jgi:Fe-S-cluster formation regulator IscX/YfhJ